MILPVWTQNESAESYHERREQRIRENIYNWADMIHHHKNNHYRKYKRS